MSNQLKIASLGRPFKLGMLYDCCTERIIPGKTLWKEETLKSALHIERKNSSSYTVITEDTIQSKCCHLGIDGNLKLSLFSRLVDRDQVGGAAKFFHEKKSSAQVSRVSLKYTSTTHFEQLDMDKIGLAESPEVMEDQDATHVVTRIEYGADAFFVFDRTVSRNEKINEIKKKMEAAIKCIPKFSAGTSTLKRADKQETDKFQCKFHGDLSLPSSPSTFEDVVKAYKDLGKHMEDMCVPKLIYLCPLPKTQGIPRQIPSNTISEVEKIMEEFSHAEVWVNDIQQGTCSKYCKIEKPVVKFVNLLMQHKASFISELHRILPSIRSNEVEEEKLSELIKSFQESSSSFTQMRASLDSKELEIQKNLVQDRKCNIESESKAAILEWERQIKYLDTASKKTNQATEPVAVKQPSVPLSVAPQLVPTVVKDSAVGSMNCSETSQPSKPPSAPPHLSPEDQLVWINQKIEGLHHTIAIFASQSEESSYSDAIKGWEIEIQELNREKASTEKSLAITNLPKLLPNQLDGKSLSSEEIKHLIQDRELSFLRCPCFKYEEYTECSALMVASLRGLCDEANLVLIKDSAHAREILDMQDSKGQSALMFASIKGHKKVSELLVKEGAWVDQQDKDGQSALMLASGNGNCEVAEVLMKGGADVDLQDKKGLSALMHACKNTQYDTAKLLIEKGADIDQQSLEWESAMSLAQLKSQCDQNAEQIKQQHDIINLLNKKIEELASEVNKKTQDKAEDKKTQGSAETGWEKVTVPLSARTLILFKYKEGDTTKQFRLENQVSADWMIFGRLLEFKSNELNGINRNHNGMTSECWHTVMNKWMQRFDVTWENVYVLLEDAQYEQVARDLKRALLLAINPPTPLPAKRKTEPPASHSSDENISPPRWCLIL